jgi:hypothetical protein
MKKHLLSLGICLTLLQIAKPAEAQTMASAKASTSVSHADERQPAEALPTLKSHYNYSIKAVKSESGFEQGDILISPGISFGAVGYGYGFGDGGSGFLPVSVSAEYSINDKFAVGPYVGFYSRSYSGTDFKWTSFSFGAKGTLHATGLLNEAFDSSMDAEKIDLFASTYLGIRTVSFNESFLGQSASGSDFRFGLTIGGRYFFNPNIGAFLELGYGALGVGTLGVSFRL